MVGDYEVAWVQHGAGRRMIKRGFADNLMRGGKMSWTRQIFSARFFSTSQLGGKRGARNLPRFGGAVRAPGLPQSAAAPPSPAHGPAFITSQLAGIYRLAGPITLRPNRKATRSGGPSGPGPRVAAEE